MSIWHTPEREQLRKTVRAFAEREVLPNVDEWERTGDAAARAAPQGRRRRPAGSGPARSGRRRRRRRRGRGGHLRGDALLRRTRRCLRLAVHLWHLRAAHDRLRRRAVDRHLRAADAARRRDRQPRHHRTGRRFGRRAPDHPRCARWRRLHHQRREDLHHLRCAGRLRGDRRAHGRPRRGRCFADRRRQGHTRIRGHPQAGQDGLAVQRHRRTEPTPTSGCPPPTSSAGRTPASSRSPARSSPNASASPRRRMRARNVAST